MSIPESTDTNGERNSSPAAGSALSGEGTSPPRVDSSDFQAGYVATFTFAHGVHDTYSAFMAPLLPALIAKFSLSMTEAGLLDFARTIPALLQPFVGHLGDRVNLRYLIILSPAIAATLMSLLGVAPSYALLLILALSAGLGSAGLPAGGAACGWPFLRSESGMGHGHLGGGRGRGLRHWPGAHRRRTGPVRPRSYSLA